MQRQIIDTIEKFNKIIIIRHVRPDPDAYGSQMGLKELIKENYPEKEVYAVGEHEESLSYLGSPDVVEESLYKEALIIVTDTGNTERIDSDFYTKGALLMKIDHHPNTDPYGDVKWVDTKASSTSEMITALFEEGEVYRGWKMPSNAARLLFAGIVGDTGRFMFPSATDLTFERASKLIKYDFDRAELFAGMYEVERKLLHLQGYIFQNFEIDDNGAAFIKLDRATLQKFDVSPIETSQLGGALGEVKGICSWVIFIEEEHQIRARLRSKGPAINSLAEEYRGGGHPLASGASVRSWEEADELVMKLKELCVK
ncbi:DHH family phosphoesterase [Sporosarcina sp. CAU 1771]